MVKWLKWVLEERQRSDNNSCTGLDPTLMDHCKKIDKQGCSPKYSVCL